MPYDPKKHNRRSMRLKGYDYWALGHIHQRERLCDEQHIYFAGNLQGRHIREAGAKGVGLGVFGFGVVAALTYLWSRNLWPLIIGHTMTDLIWLTQAS